jgi:ribosomal protein S6
MQSYETIFITPTDIKDDDLNKVLDKIKDAVSKNEGELSKLEKWQQREFAYPINDLTKGVYYIAEYKANSGVVNDIESSFKFLREEILRFLTVKVKPAKVKPAKPEPAKPEPAKPEPAKPEPVKSEPVKPEPVKPEPAKTEPAKTESENTDNSAFKTPDAKPTEQGGES